MTPSADQEGEEFDSVGDIADEYHIDAQGKIRGEPYTGIIGPAFTTRFKHLVPHLGNIVIGNSFFQAVLPGVAVDPQSTETPLIVAAFFEFSNGRWRHCHSIPQFQFQISKNKSRPFYFKGYEFHLNEEYQSASVTLIFESKNSDLARIHFITSAKDSGLNVVSDSGSQFLWRLKFLSGESTVLPSFKNEGLDEVLTFVHRDQILALRILSGKDFQINLEGIDINLSNPGRFGIRGFEVGVGRSDLLGQVLRSQALQKCFENETVNKVIELKKNIQEKLSFIDQCIDLQPKGFFQLTFQDEPNYRLKRRAVILRSEGKRVISTYGFPGETIRFPFMEGRLISLIDPLTGDEWGNGKPFVISKNSQEAIEIPARENASIEINSTNALSEGVLLKVRPMSSDDIDVNQSDFILSANTSITEDQNYFAENWPIRLELFSGMYEIKLTQPNGETLCEFTQTLHAYQQEKLTCAVERKENREINR